MEEYGRPSGEKTRAFDSTGGGGRERWGVGGHWGVEGGEWVSKAIIAKVINTIKVIINKIIITKQSASTPSPISSSKMGGWGY